MARTHSPDPDFRVAIYARISSDREGRELGVDRQRQDCLAYAAERGWTVVEIYIDNDISASTKSKKPRPQYKQMLSDARAGQFDGILAYTSGRLTRRPREHEDQIELAVEHGTRYIYLRSPSFDLNTSAGRRIARTMAAQDIGEAEDIAERVQRTKAQTAANGGYRGGRRPFGFEPDGVTLREEEAHEIRSAANALLSGVSLNSVARGLNGRGVPTSTGKPWDGGAVRRVLTRARNAGLIEAQGKVVGPASWTPIVDEGTWRAVVALISDPTRRTSPPPGRRWLLSGIARCGVCDAPVSARSARNGVVKGDRWPVYSCSAKRHVARAAHAVDEIVTHLVVNRLTHPDAVDLLSVESDGVDVAELHRQALALRQRKQEAGVGFARGAVDLFQLETINKDLDGNLREIEGALAAAARRSVFAGLVGAADVAEAWRGLELDRRRAVIAGLVRITLDRAHRGRPAGWRPGQPYFDPETVRIEWIR